MAQDKLKDITLFQINEILKNLAKESIDDNTIQGIELAQAIIQLLPKLAIYSNPRSDSEPLFWPTFYGKDTYPVKDIDKNK